MLASAQGHLHAAGTGSLGRSGWGCSTYRPPEGERRPCSTECHRKGLSDRPRGSSRPPTARPWRRAARSTRLQERTISPWLLTWRRGGRRQQWRRFVSQHLPASTGCRMKVLWLSCSGSWRPGSRKPERCAARSSRLYVRIICAWFTTCCSAQRAAWCSVGQRAGEAGAAVRARSRAGRRVLARGTCGARPCNQLTSAPQPLTCPSVSPTALAISMASGRVARRCSRRHTTWQRRSA